METAGLFLICSVLGGVVGYQTDWSGGAGQPGPVPLWTDAYAIGSKVVDSIPGEIGTEPLGERPSFGGWQGIVDDFQSAFSICTGDMDGNGTFDVVSSAWNGSIILSLNDSSGTVWTNLVLDESPGSPTYIRLGGFDQGDLPGILTCLQNENEVVWYQNPSWNRITIASPSQPFQAVAWNPDSTGADDVLCASLEDGVLWYENTDGQGQAWTEHAIDSELGQARFVAAGDMNADGLTDVTAATSDGFVYWYGAPAWEKNVVAENIGTVDAMAVLDLNDDGFADVVLGRVGSQASRLYLNPGEPGGEWVPRNLNNTQSMTFAFNDLDQDGDIDIVASNPLDDVFSVLINDGTGESWELLTVDCGTSPFSDLSLADIDGDDKIDVVGASYYDNLTVWCPGLTALVYPAIASLSSSILYSETLDTWDNLFLEIAGEGQVLMRFRASDNPSAMGGWSQGIPGPVIDVTDFIQPGDRYCQYMAMLLCDGSFNPATVYDVQLTSSPTGVEPSNPSVKMIEGPWPNPCPGSFTVSVNAQEPVPVTISCFDIAGRLVFEREEMVYSEGWHEIRMEGLTTGMYLLLVKVQEQSATARLVVLE